MNSTDYLKYITDEIHTVIVATVDDEGHPVTAAIDLMDRDAIVNIAVYPGHAEGDAEGKLICEFLSSLSRYRVCCTKVQILNSPTSPYFIAVETKP